MLAPSDGAIVTTEPVLFSWEAVAFTENYLIQVATPNFDNPVQVLVNEMIPETNFSSMLIDGDYEWRVKAMNSDSETAYTSSLFTVNLQDEFQNRLVVITAPIDDFVSNQTTVALQWLAVDDATLYRVQLIDPVDSSILDEQMTKNTSLSFTFPDGDYMWQVRAENSTENTEYTSQNITIDSVVPNTPLLLTPADTEVATDTSVIFTWSRDPIEGTEEIDTIFIYNDIGLTNLIFTETTTESMYTATLTSGETYYWFVKASDAAGNESEDSAVFSVEIE